MTMTRDDMIALVRDFDEDYGRAIQHIARMYPKSLELGYEVIAELRGRRQS